MAGLAAGLEHVRASTIAREGAWVLFYVRFFRLVWNTNLLCPIDSGAINAEVDGDAIKISYRLHTIRLCVIVTGMALAFVVFSLYGNLDLMAAGGVGLLAWLWLFGANYLTALVRFRWFVRGCVREGFAGPNRMPRAA